MLLRAVLGASDGLVTNLSLVMGVAGANLPGHTILFTGLAGMLAGALYVYWRVALRAERS